MCTLVCLHLACCICRSILFVVTVFGYLWYLIWYCNTVLGCHCVLQSLTDYECLCTHYGLYFQQLTRFSTANKTHQDIAIQTTQHGMAAHCGMTQHNISLHSMHITCNVHKSLLEKKRETTPEAGTWTRLSTYHPNALPLSQTGSSPTATIRLIFINQSSPCRVQYSTQGI